MRIFLAPMEGVVDHHFRNLYAGIGGIDVCVSEFVRVNDLPVPRKKLLRECPELKDGGQSLTPNGVPVRIQLLGSNPQTLAQSALTAASLGACAIDLNFGCPAKTVNKSRGGAVLLKDTNLIADIVRHVRQAVPANIPVTAKIRLGFDDRSLYLENALAIAEAGADELCVHARSRADGYKPPAYWPCIGEINEALNIPVIANGEIWTLEDWQQCKSESGCNDFMLGRGLMACPNLALQIKAFEAGEDQPVLGWNHALNLLYRYYLVTLDAYPRRYLGNRVKQWLHYLQLCYPEAEQFFVYIKRFREQADFDQAFAQARLQWPVVN